MIDDLIAFLRARLDERQAMIDRANNVAMNGFETVDEEAWSSLADPDFAAADVAAKRRIIELAVLYADEKFPNHDGGYADGMADAVALLAQPYADNPDYREEWKP
jgi:hypothetical protein